MDSMSRTKRCIRNLAIGVVVVVIVLVVWLSLSAIQIRRTNLEALNRNLPDWNEASSSERVLIIAPHCDDETLGCGGLIQGVVARGAQVKVVVATNGDGFYSAAARDFRDLVVSPSKYVEFGYQRQRETLSALTHLGVHSHDVIFLGYPDRGLSRMWLYNWDPSRPYTSGYTRDSSSPYDNAFRPQAPYCGRALMWDLRKIIQTYRPTSVYFPHPNEQHPDHWAANCFVVQALYESGMLGKTRAGLYIVHRGDWPVPQGLHMDLPLVPPASLCGTGTRWYECHLSPEDQKTKLEAINMYRTQLPILKRFMLSFDRTTEIFGSYDPEAPASSGPIDIWANDTAWNRIEPCIVDPSGDSLDVEVGRSGDIRAVQCARDGAWLYVRVTFAARCSRRLRYGIRLHGLPDDVANSSNLLISRGSIIRGVGAAHMRGNTITARIPMSRLGSPTAVMVSADSFAGKVQLDRCAWRLLLLRRSTPIAASGK